MKKFAFVLLGLALAAMALTIAVRFDIVTIWVGVACAYGAYRSFRAAGRLAPAAPAGGRPWQR